MITKHFHCEKDPVDTISVRRGIGDDTTVVIEVKFDDYEGEIILNPTFAALFAQEILNTAKEAQ